MGQAELAEPTSGVRAARRLGRSRLALAFFAVQLVAIFAADALLGSRGLGWFRGPGGAGGVGAAFGLIWAALTWLRLLRGETWRRALLRALAIALPLGAMAAGLMHVVRM